MTGSLPILEGTSPRPLQGIAHAARNLSCTPAKRGEPGRQAGRGPEMTNISFNSCYWVCCRGGVWGAMLGATCSPVNETCAIQHTSLRGWLVTEL